ncbi:hypothetical protein [Streptomyces sp. Iso 434]|uniref:hypothetical protein n=1 Tax=Streptomyces sp. Iso 434 TaxID=3062272 RepID=UPI003980B3B5
MTGRCVAGWAVLALVPLALVALAVFEGELAPLLDGKLVQLASGLGLTAFCAGATWLGFYLLATARPNRPGKRP